MTDWAQGDRGEVEWVGRDGRGFGFIPAALTYTATSVDSTIFTADRAYRVKTIICRVEVAGTDAGAVTAVIRKVPTGTAIASGTALHSGTFNLKGTAATNQQLTLSTTDDVLNIAQGESIAVDFTGVLTSAVGCVTVNLCPR